MSYLSDLLYISRVFTTVPGDMDSIPGRIVPQTSKMVLMPPFITLQHYKVRIKGKLAQFRE